MHQFRSISDTATTIAGNRLTLVFAIALCVAWVACGLVVGFSLEWFLVSNIAGTVGSLLMLLLIQNAKTRETLAIQAKVDQLILSSSAGNHWVGVERREADAIDEMRDRHHGSS